MDLYTGLITKEQMIRFEKSCATIFGVYRKKKLNAAWYHNRALAEKIFGVADWKKRTLTDYHYCGPLLPDKNAKRSFLEYLTVFLDNHEIQLQTDKIKCRFAAPKPPPLVGPEEVLVFHGECFTDYTVFEANIEGEFKPDELICWFEDCGENGYVLERITYGSESLHRFDTASEKEKLGLQFYAGQ